MEYNKLVSITGLSGLYELLSSKSDGGVVRSLEDKSTKFVSTRIHSFLHLESIEVFTKTENVNLVDVFTAMKASTETVPGTKADTKAIRAYFDKVYPDMDYEKVYASDMKKMLRWYEILTANDVELKLSEHADPDATAAETTASKTKPAITKSSALANAPARKINTPRKMV